jgi:hypothetical protein
MEQDAKDRLTAERDRLRGEFETQLDPHKSAQLYAAKQALDWALDQNIAAAPTWVILAGKAQPLMGTLEG